jgi:hypothetical protein
MRNGTGVALLFLGGTCGLLGDSCGRPELPRRDADEALEVMGELALVREAGAQSDLRQGQVAALLGQERCPDPFRDGPSVRAPSTHDSDDQRRCRSCVGRLNWIGKLDRGAGKGTRFPCRLKADRPTDQPPNLAPVDPAAVLQKSAQLPSQTTSPRGQRIKKTKCCRYLSRRRAAQDI